MASPNELWLTDFGAPYPGKPAHFRPALVVLTELTALAPNVAQALRFGDSVRVS